MKKTIVVATFLAFTSFALVITQISLKKFVQVFLATNDDPNDPQFTCAIAGLGIYYTTYDSSCLDDEALQRSRVPAESFTSPTTQFKLLFPAQQNFVSEVLPVNDALVNTLEDTFGTNAIFDLLKDDIAQISNTEFTTCSTYMTEIETEMLKLFDDLFVFLPSVIPFIVQAGIQQFTNATATVSLTISLDSATNANPFYQNLFGTWLLLGENSFLHPACVNTTFADFEQDMDDGDRGCIETLYALVGNSLTAHPSSSVQAIAPLFFGISNYISNFCSATISMKSCLASLSAEIQPSSPILAPFLLQGGTSNETMCSVWSPVCQTSTTYAEFLQMNLILASTILSVDSTALPAQLLPLYFSVASGVTNLGIYAVVLQKLTLQVINFNSGNPFFDADTVVNYLDTLDDTVAFPTSFNGYFPPCAVLQITETLLDNSIPGGFSVPQLADTNETVCGFDVFFPAAAAIAAATEDPLASLVSALSELFSACSAIPTLNPQTCDTFFPSVFINGAYQFAFDMSAFIFNPSGVFLQAVDACEDDEVDLEKFQAAQAAMGVATGGYFLSVILGGAALTFHGFKQIKEIKFRTLCCSAAAVFSLLSAGLNIGALFIVRGAPVYGSVTATSQATTLPTFAPLYYEGVVVLLALVTAIVSATAALTFIGGIWAEKRPGIQDAKNEQDKAIIVAEVI